MNISEVKRLLADSLGNKIELINILKDVTDSDYVDLLWYNKEDDAFVDRLNNKKTPINFLIGDEISMLGEAYKTKAPYCSTHLKYEPLYNVAIDNPFKLDISSQLIFPIELQDEVIGIIRFSKQKYTFSKKILKNLKLLEGNLIEIFSSELDGKLSKLSEKFFYVDIDCIYYRLNTIKNECKNLLKETHNPEVSKLILKLEMDIDEIYNYIHFADDNSEKKQSSTTKLNILIADDVRMNVKILYAMLKDELDMEFLWAYDGIETLTKIEKAKANNKPIDILFLDHHMPGKLGLEIAQEIRAKEQNNNTHKMIIVSITNDPDAIKSHKHLFDYHISKPFSKTEISSLIKNIQNKITQVSDKR